MTEICFLHISKTSGTSVTMYLESQFHAAEVCPARSGDEFSALGPAKLRGFKMFRAECDASVIDLLRPATPVVTLLREPLARAYSHWRYIQRLPEHRLYEQFQHEHATFEHFLTALPTNPVAKLLAARERSGASPGGLWEQSCDSGDDVLFDRALSRIESFAVVGITEHHDESIAQIAHHFGWAPPGRLPLTNAAAPLPDGYVASAAEQAVFDERNNVDCALYRAAVAIFERRRRLVDPQARAALYEERVATDTSQLTGRLVVDMCSPIQGSGWLRVVDTESGPMRPIGVGGIASVDLPVTVGRFTKLEVSCPAVSSDLALASLEITVNGEPIAFGHRLDPDRVTLNAVLPPSAPTERFTRITFRAQGGVAVPPNHTGALSNLEATLGISRIELIPYDPKALRVTFRRAGADPAPVKRSAGVISRQGPTWTFAVELQRRLDQLDLWGHVEALQRNGYTVVEQVVTPETTRRARAVICRLAVGSNHRTRRRDILQPLRVDPLFVELLVNPVQLALADAVCGKAMLDSQIGLVRDRTSNPHGLHAENALWLPAPYPDHHYVCSAMLTLDDFSDANGGTCFVPGSHLTKLDPTPEQSSALTGAVTPEAPAGSLIVWLGGTWHGARQRMTEGERISLLTSFTRPSLRPAQDIRGIPDALVDTDELRVRLRRKDPFERIGWYNDDPDEMLHWIRNVPHDGALTCGWNETVDADRRRNQLSESASPT